MASSQPLQDRVSAVDETAINATIKGEMDKINQSLAKITQCLNVSSPFFTLKSTGNQSLAAAAQVRVKEEVAESLNRSMGLWNSMMNTFNNRTSLNISSLQNSQVANSMSMSYMGSGVNQSFASQISIKEDARDLLQKYSDLLLEEIKSKLLK